MRKLILIFTAGSILFAIPSCKKSTTAFTQTQMKPWFDRNCSSCHGKGGSNSSAWFYNPSDYTTSIKNQISTLKHVVLQVKTMPPTAISQSELDTFQNWIDNGFPAN